MTARLDPLHHVDPALGRRVDRLAGADARRLQRFRRIRLDLTTDPPVTDTAIPATAVPDDRRRVRRPTHRRPTAPATDPPATDPPVTEAALAPFETIEPGPYDVGVQTITITDASRNRPLTVDVWFPIDDATGLPAHQYTLLPGVYYESPTAVDADRDHDRLRRTVPARGLLATAAAGCATSTRTTPRRSPATGTSSPRPTTPATRRSSG